MRLLPKSALFVLVLMSLAACAAAPVEPESYCLEISLTGTQGGPPVVNGLAGAGTLVRYGRVANNCSDVLLQFDAGRGTLGRLSQLGVSPLQLDGIFLTHLHSDHTEGLAALLQYRWHFLGAPIDVICSADVIASKPPPERTMSCRNLLAHSADAMLQSGEIAQRYAENKKRNPAGPSALVVMKLLASPLSREVGISIWQSGEVSVSAITTTHIAGSLAYRVDTPAGSVVIGGDAGNNTRTPPRRSSTSESVEKLARDADVLVHSVIHPVFAPGAGSTFPAPVFFRQSNAADLGAMAERAGVKYLLLTHLIPSLNAASHGPYAIPGGALDSDDFASAARESGFRGDIYVGKDLLTLRLPQPK
ncbi:MAG: MBL fold metallo-hydrolase [Proteobacteria bacterium]|nr:MBL fold metallo-hydrolase [Pseudomonadota bacterium]